MAEIDAKLIGASSLTRLYACEFAIPGKWTCILEVDEYRQNPGSVDTDFLPNNVGVSGWTLVRKELIRQEAHVGVYHYTYEGIVTSPPLCPSDTRPFELQRCVFSASVSLIRQPISMHPRFADIVSRYKGRLLYGEWDWPQTDPTGQSTNSGTDANGNPVASINPLYAVQEYLTPNVTLRANTMEQPRYLTPSIASNHGYTENPPAAITNFFGLTRTSGGSGAAAYDPWLMTENSVSQHGSGVEISKGWMSGQWNKVLYKK